MPHDDPESTENTLQPRSSDEIATMAAVAQANVVQLRTAELKRTNDDPNDHDIRVAAPGPITRFRDALIDHRLIKSYNALEVHLRLHESWGQFCLLCWCLQVDDVQHPPTFSGHTQFDIRCAEVIEIKKAEIIGSLWRLRFEQRLRSDPAFDQSPDFPRARAASREVHVSVFGKPVNDADDAAITVCACEFAGMLAAVRWAADRRIRWGAPGIMDIEDSKILGGAVDL